MYEYYGNNDYRDYLIHHGILGMKWGVRRYQNKYGSYTPAGKKRYGIGDRVKAAHKKRTMMNSYDYRQSDQYKNATSRQKATKTNIHNNTKQIYGKKSSQ